MIMNAKIIKESATTVYVHSEDTSYGIFCFNNSGDLFVNSDWGFYGYAWRHYSGSFIDFLSGCNAEYIVGKFEINYGQTNKSRMMPIRKEKVTLLVKEFLLALKSHK